MSSSCKISLTRGNDRIRLDYYLSDHVLLYLVAQMREEAAALLARAAAGDAAAAAKRDAINAGMAATARQLNTTHVRLGDRGLGDCCVVTYLTKF